MPLVIRSTRTPAWLASYSASISSGSTREFIFMVIRPSEPKAHLPGDQIQEARAQRAGRHDQATVRVLAGEPGQVVEQLAEVRADLGVAGQEPEVLVQPGGGRVVVAGADVGVAAQTVRLVPDDERALGVGLQAHDAVDDVDAGLLQAAWPR